MPGKLESMHFQIFSNSLVPNGGFNFSLEVLLSWQKDYEIFFEVLPLL